MSTEIKVWATCRSCEVSVVLDEDQKTRTRQGMKFMTVHSEHHDHVAVEMGVAPPVARQRVS